MSTIGKIRERLAGIPLLGAEAIEFRQGAIVLVVLRPKEEASLYEIEQIREVWVSVAELLQEQGVRAVAAVVPHRFNLEVIEVQEGVQRGGV